MTSSSISNPQGGLYRTRTRLAAMSPVRRRRDIAKEIISSRPLSDGERHHIHSVLALCGLPYRRPADDKREYKREYGRNSLVVQAGYLKDPVSGQMISQGLPYGPKARLMMLNICTMALRQNSPEIEVADSMSAFIRDMGFSVTGGKNGTIAIFKEQLHRLAAARMQIGLWNGSQSSTINTQPIEAFDIWLPTEPNQKTLWNSTVHLDQKFFQSLKQHALPVDIRALGAFANSARQIDMMLWLAYRLHQLERKYTVGWSALREQFGADINSRDRKFRQSFMQDLRGIQEVFPKLAVKLTEKGLTLFPCNAGQVFVAPRTAKHLADR